MFLNSKNLKIIFKIFCVLAVLFLILTSYPQPTQALITCPSSYTCQDVAGMSDATMDATECYNVATAGDECDARGVTWRCCRPLGAGETGEGAGAADKYGLGEAGASLSKTPISGRVSTLIGALVGFVGVIFLVLMIYGGLTWMTAGGNEEKIGKAKKIIVNSTIGLVIVMLSYAITYYIITTVTKAG